MPSEMTTCYYFKDGLKVELIHYVNNKYAAEKAMLNAYKRTQHDISHTGGRRTPGNSYVTFDGRNFH